MTAKRCLLLSIALLGALAGAPAALAAETASEQAVRAALLFNFIKFADWQDVPAGATQLRLCVASDDPAQTAALEALGNRPIRGMRLAVAPYHRPGDCDVIYVDSHKRWREIAGRPGNSQALAIGNYPGFVADGGMIGISLQDGSLRFDINLAEAKRAGIRLSPQLLRLARHVLE